MTQLSRRDFLCGTLAGAAALAGAPLLADTPKKGSNIKTGLCTYLWGANWDLPTLIANCAQAGLGGVELRVQHKHGVEPELGKAQREDVRKRFADSPITLVGFGTNEDFHHTDPARVRHCIERAKEYVILSADCGGSGVKVKPNDLPKGVDQKKTTAQIAAALNELGKFAADYGQQIRLENHGGCAPIPIMKEIIEQVTEKNVGLCWNCNPCDMNEPGFVENFRSVITRLGATIHVHDPLTPKYPYEEMIPLLVEQDYDGWLLLECSNTVADGVAAMARSREYYEELIAKAG